LGKGWIGYDGIDYEKGDRYKKQAHQVRRYIKLLFLSSSVRGAMGKGILIHQQHPPPL
jgi:hypothetical protein